MLAIVVNEERHRGNEIVRTHLKNVFPHQSFNPWYIEARTQFTQQCTVQVTE